MWVFFFGKSSSLAAWLLHYDLHTVRVVGRDVSAGSPTALTARQIGNCQCSSPSWLFFISMIRLPRHTWRVMSDYFYPTGHFEMKITPASFDSLDSGTWHDGRHYSHNPPKRSGSLSWDLIRCTCEELHWRLFPPTDEDASDAFALHGPSTAIDCSRGLESSQAPVASFTVCLSHNRQTVL